MPPRHAYWTILIDQRPTAFRAKDRDDLLPTVRQLQRTNSDVVMKWFARGRIWDSPEQADWARKQLKSGPREQRDKHWRPGGDHRDPRARFRKAPAHPRANQAGTPPAPSESRPQSPSFRSQPGPPGRPFQSKPLHSKPIQSKPRHSRPSPSHPSPPQPPQSRPFKSRSFKSRPLPQRPNDSRPDKSRQEPGPTGYSASRPRRRFARPGKSKPPDKK
jgi:hypothetical protein